MMTPGSVLIRVLRGILAIVIAVSASFFILRLLPGGPTALMLDGVNDPELERELLAQFGLDRLLLEQIWLFWGELLRGNLGISFYSLKPVTEALLLRLPWTLLLMGLAFLITLALSLVLGVRAAEKRGGLIDWMLQYLGAGGQAMFVPGLAVLLLAIFAVALGWFPVGGASDSWAVRAGGFTLFMNVLWHLAMPLLVLVLVQLGSLALTVRATMVQVFTESYMVTAVAKGLKRSRVVWLHGVRTGLLPVLTVAGMQLGMLLGGAVLTETVFAYPGVGLFIYESVLRQDFPVLQGAFILLAITVVLANLIIDLLARSLDP
ncbi:MAG: ABC transporter permease, partial [Microbacteriaceae bacterium]